MAKFVEKSWGSELWFENNEKYCGKVLYIKNNHWSSKGNFHYHLIKDETFYVIDGRLHLEYEEEDQIKIIVLTKDNYFRIKPGVKHRFTSQHVNGCKFMEVSTTHDDNDSFRCYYDNKENKWVNV